MVTDPLNHLVLSDRNLFLKKNQTQTKHIIPIDSKFSLIDERFVPIHVVPLKTLLASHRQRYPTSLNSVLTHVAF